MGVICFGSLKGGVGKTSLSINIAHAFAERGCQTLLIDCDPMGHTTRFFIGRNEPQRAAECPLAKLFFSPQISLEEDSEESLLDAAFDLGLKLVSPVREELDLIQAGPELRHFLWGRGARALRACFPRLIEELRGSYDHIIIDTAPDWNIITRNAIACAELVVVPVDSSEMSIYALEEIVNSAAHIHGPAWAIIRSMVNRQASKVQELATSRLRRHLQDFSRIGSDIDDEELEEPDIEDAGEFIALLRQREEARRLEAENAPTGETKSDKPIYLLNSVVHRTEQQNKLTFQGRTAFDSRATHKLGEQYNSVARELEQILSVATEVETEVDENFFETAYSKAG